ncbi:hypothetical protein B0H16DRAFT_1499215 [Mycena metata]|uniref:Uncharacterized protein n=1 Tax=Mycena metata TaxID=1033252 RepID=A0AAD7NZ42_9AGAR|nr:hypothetical protein B0H16DRAFT_1499215 [Mycena metata]
MAAHRSPRLHRFPHRIDYTLIPAPLDLSLPEKGDLPAIIVTPSSPSSAHDFSIAFLAPPPKPSIRERLGSYAPFDHLPIQRKARTMIILSLIFFVLICHVVTHRLAARRPHLEFSPVSFGNWVIRSIWGEDSAPDAKREFIVDDFPPTA